MTHLAIDIETYSSADLSKCGVYKYAEAPDFTVLMLAYQYNDGPVQIIDLAMGETIPPTLLSAIKNPEIKKTAHNAAFERACLAKYLHAPMPPEQWECTMVKAAIASLPLSLDEASKALNLAELKDDKGKALIRFFSIPCKPTRANGMRSRNLPQHDLFRWEEFKQYCMQDVVVESAIREALSHIVIPDHEKQVWQLDQTINDRGIMADRHFIHQAIAISMTSTDNLLTESAELTGLNNPNSVAQLKSWLNEHLDDEVESLTKDTTKALLKGLDDNTPEAVRRALRIRQELSKTSVKKYESMRDTICADDRCRGLIQYYGSRTGRWAGRLVQVQNLPKNKLKDLDLARRIVATGDSEAVELIFGNVPDTLSQLIRTAFIAPAGSRFIVADFSAIEARVIAWLAGEKWRLDVFASHGKIYEASGAQMFKIPIEEIKDPSPIRDKAKIAELALGYQGAVNALLKMGALSMGLKEDELPKLVNQWRAANKKIVKFWNDTEEAAIDALENNARVKVNGMITFYKQGQNLVVELPSGRCLYYVDAKMKQNRYGNQAITYMAQDQTTRRWGRQETYGGKLVENIVQAVARDILAYSMLRLDAVGYKIVMHVHDEVVIEAPYGFGSAQDVVRIMREPFDWSAGLPMNAKSYETEYYKKD